MDTVLASAIVKVVVAKFAEMACDKIKMINDFKEELKDMTGKLSAIQDVLEDAEQRCMNDKALSNWLKKLKDVAYDLDDLLEVFQQRNIAGKNDQVSIMCNCKSISKPVIAYFTIANKMKILKRRLQSISEERIQFRLSPNVPPSWTPERETYSKVDESMIVGRESEKEDIMELLLDTTLEEDVSVIPIVGMGGLGKTTLAQLVFNDKRTNNEIFDPIVWVCVSTGFDLKTIIQPILSATKETCDINNLESIASCLSKVFTEKRYLLVLDDVWNENQDEWEKLKLLLKDGKRGSKIIVTTRSRKVAMIMRTVRPYFLKGLTDHDCWELFKRKAFEKEEDKEYPGLVKIGKEIVKKCGGNPLAANALGSMMRFKRTEESWTAVRDSEIWSLEHEKTILPSLRLSYFSLQPQLKECFAYCSIFPKHYEIDRDKLIQQWIALGFIRSNPGENWKIEDKGNEYFNHLIWMSFLQEVEPGKPAGSVKYVMHHLVYDLAKSVAGNEVTVISEDEDASRITEGCRYASLTSREGDSPSLVPRLKKVRALHLRNSPLHKKSYFKTKFLRILDLHGLDTKELPNSILKLKHLRYLDVSSTRLKELPESISMLSSLQTLYLSHCPPLQKIPNSIGKLQSLCNLDLTACEFKSLPNSLGSLHHLQTLNLSLCSRLETLPVSFGSLQKLTTLNLQACYNLAEIPTSICTLTSLKYLNLSQCSFKRLPESIGALSNLLNFNLSACNDLIEVPESLGCIEKLHTLNLSDCSALKTLPESLGRLQNLQVLNISHYSDIIILPEAVCNLANLQIMNLSMNISIERLPESIGGLRHLRTLVLSQCWALQELPISLTNLVKLEILDLAGCENLTELPEGLGNMINLRHLINYRCWSLKGLPLGFGKLTNLQTLSLFIIDEANNHSSIAELEHLNLLQGELHIYCPGTTMESREDGEKAKLKNKQKLQSITLSWKSRENVERAEALFESLLPHQNLERLTIDGYPGTRFSRWMSNDLEFWLPNVVHLNLREISGCTYLPSLGRLLSLQSLELRSMPRLHCLATENYDNDIYSWIPYPSLKELFLEDLPILQEWPASTIMRNGHGGTREVLMFPFLRSLSVVACPKLRPKPHIPSSVIDFSVCNSSQMLSLHKETQASPLKPSLLRRLWIKSCELSADGWKGLRYHTKLEDLIIEGCGELTSLPEVMQHHSSLERFKILHCVKLQQLPKWLVDIKSLVSLEIIGCSSLTSLPDGLHKLQIIQ